MRIGELLAEKKYERGISEYDLAELFDVSQASVNRWLAGQNTPTRPYWPAIARFLGITQKEVADLVVAEKRGRSPSGIEARLEGLENRLANVERLLDELAHKRR